MKMLTAPDGTPIKGRLETTPCVACGDPVRKGDGSIGMVWDGTGSDMLWDDQKPQWRKNPQTGLNEEVFVDENGDTWLASQLIDSDDENDFDEGDLE